jgi:hypothetical protein
MRKGEPAGWLLCRKHGNNQRNFGKTLKTEKVALALEKKINRFILKRRIKGY